MSNWRMNPYYNLPPEQWRLQRLVDAYNADAQLWKKLEPNAAPGESSARACRKSG